MTAVCKPRRRRQAIGLIVFGLALRMAVMAAISLAAVLHIEDQDHDFVVVNLVQDPPVTGPDSPRPRIPDKLRCLSWPGIFCKPVDDARHLLPDRTIKPLECLTRLVAEDDLINHRLQASFSLDLIPRD